MWTVIQRRTTPLRSTQRQWSPSILKKSTSRADNRLRILADFQKPRWPWCASRCLATIVKLTRWIPQNITGRHSSSEWPHGGVIVHIDSTRPIYWGATLTPSTFWTHSQFFEGAGFGRATKQRLLIHQIHHETRKRQRTSLFGRHGKMIIMVFWVATNMLPSYHRKSQACQMACLRRAFLADGLQ